MIDFNAAHAKFCSRGYDLKALTDAECTALAEDGQFRHAVSVHLAHKAARQSKQQPAPTVSATPALDLGALATVIAEEIRDATAPLLDRLAGIEARIEQLEQQPIARTDRGTIDALVSAAVQRRFEEARARLQRSVPRPARADG